MRPVARYSPIFAARSRPIPGSVPSSPRAATASTLSATVAPADPRRVRARVARVHRDDRRPGTVRRHDPLQVARAPRRGRDGAVPRGPGGLDRRPLRWREVQDEPPPRDALREHEELQAGGRAPLVGDARALPRVREGRRRTEMPSEETRRVLKLFGVAVTNLEDTIDRKAPRDEIMKADAEGAERTRETLALVERLRSRRIG